VNGANTHELYAILKSAKGGLMGTTDIKWSACLFATRV